MSDIRTVQTVQTELGADAARILNAYRSHATELPSLATDQRILAMAAAAPAAVPQSTQNKRRPLLWLRYAASVAVVVVGAGLTWRMVEEGPTPGRDLRRPVIEESVVATPVMPGAQPAREEPGSVATTSAQSDRGRTLSAARRDADDLVATAESAAAVSVPPNSPAPARPAPQIAPQTTAKPLQSAPAVAPALQDSMAARSRRDAAPATAGAGAAAPAAPMTPPATPVIPGDAPAALAKRAAVSPLDPQVWLDSVRALRDSGHVDEAIISLREWRLRFPTVPLPEDLQALLNGAAAAEVPR